MQYAALFLIFDRFTSTNLLNEIDLHMKVDMAAWML